MLAMWIFWSAFLGVMLFVLAASIAWALSYLPLSEAVAVSVIVLLALLCLVQGIALFFDDGGDGERQQRERAHDHDDGITNNLAALINSQRDEIRSYREQVRRNEQKRGLRESLTVTLLLLAFGAAAAQALVARRQLESFDKEAHVRLRAYVSVVHTAVYNMKKDAAGLDAYFNIANNGQTVAQKADIFAGIALHELPEPKTFDALGELKREPAPISLPPNSTPAVIHRLDRPISDEQFGKVIVDKARIYVFGRISYFDVFDDQHLIIFCNFYSGSELRPDDPRGTYPGYEAKACQNTDFNYEK
jgi:hypothetical protein